MIGQFLSATEILAKNYVRNKMVKNPFYSNLKWNFIEKNIIRLTSSPVKSVLCISAFSFVLLYVGYLNELFIKNNLLHYFPFRHSLTEWQTTILSGQLTIIGIVYPLVIGLVSVLFQKKADRKIAQTAYQRYSGFMLAGLSGLFLSGFILLSVLIKTVFGSYLYGIACLISILWLLINIVLSIWFFIVSLEILDDVKRQIIIKRYIAFEIVMPHICNKISAKLRLYPIYQKHNYSNLEITQADYKGEYISVASSYSKEDELSLYHRPFQLTLNLINYQLKKKNHFASFVIGDNRTKETESTGKILFSVKNIKPDSLLIKILKQCFYRAPIKGGDFSVSLTMQAITADTYMYLRDSDLISFDNAISALINNFNNLCDLYFFQDDNTNNNFLLITTELFERSFQYEFSDEVYKISNNSMDKINLSERFFELCLWSGVRIINNRKHLISNELCIYMGITRSQWSILTEWFRNNQSLLNASLRSRYNRILRTYITVWEQYQESINFRFCNTENSDLFELFCKTQLQELPSMIIDATQTRDPSTIDTAVDLINRWQHSMNIDSHSVEKYSYKGQLFNPVFFISKKLNFNSDREWFNIAIINALTDMRICTCLYLTSRINTSDKLMTHYIKLILEGKLIDQTGGYETPTEEIDNASQLIKILIRICLWTWSENMEHNGWMNSLARRLRDYDKTDMVMGRVYSNVFDCGFIDMEQSWVQLLLIFSKKNDSVSKEIKEAIENNYITYREKQRLIGVLSKICNSIEYTQIKLTLTLDDLQTKKENLRKLLQEHINMLKKDLDMRLQDAAIDVHRLDSTARKTSEHLRKRIKKTLPLSLFKSIDFKQASDCFTKHKISIKIDKEPYAEGIESIPYINEGDIQADLILKDIQRIILSNLFSTGCSQHTVIEDFNMLIDHIKSSADLAGKLVLVMSKEIFQQYNRMLFDNPNLRELMRKNDDGSMNITTESGTRKVYFLPFVNQQFSLVVKDNYFTKLIIREYDNNKLVNVTSENIKSDSDKFKLTLNYELNIVFEGNADLKIAHSQRVTS
ncbi:MFS transporter, partial [Shigella boydii]|nr:MFS transporter [Shigella boydii]